jgi:hypothetical protein
VIGVERQPGTDSQLEHLGPGGMFQRADAGDDARIENAGEDFVVEMRELVVELALIGV